MDQVLQLSHIQIPVQPEQVIKEGASRVVMEVRPDWPLSDHRYKVFTDGITNKLIGVYRGCEVNDMVLVRVYGHKSDLMIDRQTEISNMLLAHSGGMGAKLLACFANGLAYQFIAGSVATRQDACHQDIYPLIAASMARLHSLKPAAAPGVKASLFQRMRKFWALIPDDGFAGHTDKHKRYVECSLTKQQLLSEISFMETALAGVACPVVFCHNDLLLANVVIAPTRSQVSFIDYEYADMNYQAFDIANHFSEFAGVSSDFIDYDNGYPDTCFRRAWIRSYLTTYLSREPSQDEVKELMLLVDQFSACCPLQWCLWALVQSACSSLQFDFLGYSLVLQAEYLRRKRSHFPLAAL